MLQECIYARVSTDTMYKRTVASCLLLCLTCLPLAPLQAGLLVGTNETSSVARTAQRDSTNGPWVMAYYVGYHRDLLRPRDIDYSLMTHIVVGGVGVRADGSLDEHWHVKEGDGRAMARDVRQRAHRANVRALIWLGGPNEEDKLLAATQDSVRPTTVRNILKLVDELGYDGVDIDWEPIRKQDEPGILALVKDLRAARPNLIITLPVNWVPTTIIAKKDLSLYPKLAQHADRLFIMSYSMAGPWPGWQSWHGSALTGDTFATPGSIRSSVLAYRLAGVPKEKLGVGVGTYATCWKAPVHTPGSTYPAGYGPGALRVLNMRTLMEEHYVKRNERWDARAQVPYLVRSKRTGSDSCGFISYENERSIRLKGSYVKEQGLGGVMLWNIGTGYFKDGPKETRHRLLEALYTSVR